MKLEFSAIETKNLRVPDLNIDFASGMNFFQIPNGTGKTTLLELFRHALANDWDDLDTKTINSFKRKGAEVYDGTFSIGLKVKKEIYKITANFDFSEGTVSVDTDTPNGRKRNKFDPPRELKPFLTRNHTDIFIFSAQIASQHFTESSNVVDKAVGTFSGKLTVQNNLQKIEKKFKAKHRGATNSTKANVTEQKLEILDIKIQQLRDLEKELKEQIEKKQKKHDILDAKVKQAQENNKKLTERRDKLDGDLSELQNTFNQLENEVSNLAIYPNNISKKFNKRIKEIYLKLEKKKLPGTSSAFFDEIAEQDKCICGTEITKEIKENIVSGKDKYLGDEDIAFVNAMKTSIEDCNNGTAEKELSEKITEIRDISLLIEDKYEEISEVRSQSEEEGLTKKEHKEYRKLIEELSKLGGDLKGITKSNYESDNERKKELKDMILPSVKKYIKNIPDALWLQEYLSDQDAMAKGYKKANDNLQKVKEAIEEAIKEAEDKIKKEITTSINKMIGKIHSDQEFRVASVDKAIKIDGQGGGSGAQEVITVTTFALALLQRSSIDFPMIIDHPVKDIQNENRGELSKFLKKSTHQCICLVINSEKDGFIRDEDTRKKHDHVANSRFITAARKRNAGDFPKDSLESEDGIVTYDYEFFNSFKTSKE